MADAVDHAVTIELPQQNVTVVGAFNPAIFQPTWIKQHVPAVEGEILIGLNPEGGPRIDQAGSLFWIVTSERLVMYGPIRQIGRAVGDVLDTLRHTPLRAAGVNIQLKLRARRSRFGPWALSGTPETVRALLRGVPAELSLSQVAHRDDGVRVTTKLVWPSEQPDGLLDVNYHLEASGTVQDEREKQLAAHARRAADFEEDANRIRRELADE